MAKSQRKKPEKAKPSRVRADVDVAVRPKTGGKQKVRKAIARKLLPIIPGVPSEAAVLDRLHAVILSRRDADPAISHSARLMSRGVTKVAQKFGEESVECLIEAVTGDRDALIAESADVLYHLMVLWVSCGVRPELVWAELTRREGISGIAEKASRPKVLGTLKPGTSKIP